MSNYVKTVNFAAKDALATGNPNKVAQGTQVDTEFNNIATAVATKEDSANKGQASGYAPLNSSTLLADTYLTSNIPRLDAANIFTAINTFLASTGFKLRAATSATNVPVYVSLQQAGGTENGSVGFLTASTTLSIANAVSAGAINIATTGGGAITANGSTIWTQANDGSGSGLDADLLDGHDTSFFLAASAYTAADVMTKIQTVDGTGTGLDADLLDGNHAAAFSAAVHNHSASELTSGTLADARVASSNVTQYAAAVLATNNVTSGVYTPTGVAGSNITSITPGKAFYLRIGNYVHVHGTVVVTNNGSANCQWTLTLPVASNLVVANDLSGSGACSTSGGIDVSVYADFTNDRAQFQSLGSGSVGTTHFSFGYVVQ